MKTLSNPFQKVNPFPLSTASRQRVSSCFIHQAPSLWEFHKDNIRAIKPFKKEIKRHDNDTQFQRLMACTPKEHSYEVELLRESRKDNPFFRKHLLLGKELHFQMPRSVYNTTQLDSSRRVIEEIYNNSHYPQSVEVVKDYVVSRNMERTPKRSPERQSDLGTPAHDSLRDPLPKLSEPKNAIQEQINVPDKEIQVRGKKYWLCQHIMSD